MKTNQNLTQLDLFLNEIEDADPPLRLGALEDRSECECPELSEYPSEQPVDPCAFLEQPNMIPESDWSRFFRNTGRIPMINDKRKPWHYRGWLSYYRVVLEQHPLVSPRWDYWYRTQLQGRLLDEPIPQVHFEVCGSRECSKMLEAWLRTIELNHHGGHR